MHRIPVMRSLRLILIAWTASSTIAAASADVRLPKFFGDHLVIQRDKPTAVWGWADGNEAVTVEFGTLRATTVADAMGRWRVELPAQPADGDSRDLVVRGKNTVTLHDVVVGDVWLCGGQSNMSISAGHFFAVPEVKQDLAQAENRLIRHFGVVEHFADEEQNDATGEWLVLTPQTAARFCAVGFYFARKVQAEAGVPIGLIRAAKGSTTIELWLSQQALLREPAFESFAVEMRDSLAKWDLEKAAAATRGIRAADTEYPPFPFGEKVRRPRCTTLHNGMIAPLAGLALRGALWYQGEGNAGDVAAARRYARSLPVLIGEWRRLFRDDSLPFYFVQLPSYREATDDPAGGEPWAWFRESQRSVLSIPHTGLAVTVDVGDANDIHPTNKLDVGERLARLALKNEYGKNIEAAGPLFRELRIEGNALRIHFDGVGAGLMVGRKQGRLPVEEDRDAKLQRFAVAGEDRTWHWAEATIDGPTVVVSSTKVAKPVAVRYAYSANPAGANLYNRSGLPASPFRTDDWPPP